MGSLQAQEMAGLMRFEDAIRWHLQYNHYPPISTDFVGTAISAIDNALAEDWDTEIEMPNGKILKSSEIVDGLHLDCFVYTKAEQVEGDD